MFDRIIDEFVYVKNQSQLKGDKIFEIAPVYNIMAKDTLSIVDFELEKMFEKAAENNIFSGGSGEYTELFYSNVKDKDALFTVPYSDESHCLSQWIERILFKGSVRNGIVCIHFETIPETDILNRFFKDVNRFKKKFIFIIISAEKETVFKEKFFCRTVSLSRPDTDSFTDFIVSRFKNYGADVTDSIRCELRLAVCENYDCLNFTVLDRFAKDILWQALSDKSKVNYEDKVISAINSL